MNTLLRNTTQLINEVVSLNIAKNYLIKDGCKILSRVESHENKIKRTTADLIVHDKNNKRSTISVKTQNGVFTQHNLGTGTRAAKKWNFNPEFLKKLKGVEDKSKKIRNTLSKDFNHWSDITNKEALTHWKYKVIEPFMTFYYQEFMKNTNFLNYFLEYLNSRNSDIIIVTNNSKNKVSSTIRKPETIPKIEKIYLHNKSIIIEPIYELRFKTEGGKTKSSIKINVQPYKQFKNVAVEPKQIKKIIIKPRDKLNRDKKDKLIQENLIKKIIIKPRNKLKNKIEHKETKCDLCKAKLTFQNNLNNNINES